MGGGGYLLENNKLNKLKETNICLFTVSQEWLFYHKSLKVLNLQGDLLVNVLIDLIRGLSLFFLLSDLDEETQIALALSASMAPPPPPESNNKKSVKRKGKKNKGYGSSDALST